jgi:hypothetical protein
MLIDFASRPAVADVIARTRTHVEVRGTIVSAESILAARDADQR